MTMFLLSNPASTTLDFKARQPDEQTATVSFTVTNQVGQYKKGAFTFHVLDGGGRHDINAPQHSWLSIDGPTEELMAPGGSVERTVSVTVPANTAEVSVSFRLIAYHGGTPDIDGDASVTMTARVVSQGTIAVVSPTSWPPKIKPWAFIPGGIYLLLCVILWMVAGSKGEGGYNLIATPFTLIGAIAVSIAAGVIGSKAEPVNEANRKVAVGNWNFAWSGIITSAVMFLQHLIIAVWAFVEGGAPDDGGGALVATILLVLAFGMPAMSGLLSWWVMKKTKPAPV